MINQEDYREDLKDYDKNDTKTLSKAIKEYILSSNQTQSVRHFVELAFSKAGIKGKWNTDGSGKPENEVYLSEDNKVLVAIDPKFFRPAEVNLLWGCSDLARKELGWNPQITFDELVTRMVKCHIKEYKND